MANYRVIAIYTTPLKKEPKPSSVLPASSMIQFPEGQDLAALWVNTRLVEGHVKATFDPAALATDTDSVAEAIRQTGLNTFYLFHTHIKVLGTEPGNKPKDTPAIVVPPVKVVVAAIDVPKKNPLDFEFSLPGNRSKFNMKNEVVPGSRISWAEFLHYDKTTGSYRPPASAEVVNNIIRIVTFMKNVVRPTIANFYGVPGEALAVEVCSGYRDPVTNKAKGGALQSRHIAGDAIDFRIYIKGKLVPPPKINNICESICRECGLASASVFTHIDTRGYYARWSYGY